MLKQMALAVLLSGLALAHTHTAVEHFEQLDEVAKLGEFLEARFSQSF
jgi:hypothetical protein